MKSHNLGLVVNGWGADWNDGYGMLSQIVDSRVIRDTGGSSNTSVRIPAGGQAASTSRCWRPTSPSATTCTAEMDKQVMEQAVTYPGVYAKALMLRSKNVTNVFINDNYGGYDFLSLGHK